MEGKVCVSESRDDKLTTASVLLWTTVGELRSETAVGEQHFSEAEESLRPLMLGRCRSSDLCWTQTVNKGHSYKVMLLDLGNVHILITVLRYTTRSSFNDCESRL